jgi:carotenoid cleavage dioxygenase
MTNVDAPWFLRGNYAPVHEERSDNDLEVTGAIPPGLAGRYLRNGSNPQDGAAGHWFFGDGMIHGVRLEGGQAHWYRNRYVRTTKFERHLDATSPETMMDPTASAANTHVLAHAGRIWALEEGHLPYELTPELDTIGCDDFGGQLTTAFTAHPKLCPETGELHFFGYSVLPPYLTYHVLDASGALVHSAPITVPGATMMHDFMITRDHAVFMDLPVVFDLDAAMRGEVPLHWDDSYGAPLGIVPRFGTDADVRWFDVDPCYVFHPLNAYVDGSPVVCDVGRHASMWRDSMDDFPPSFLHRWTFDLESARWASSSSTTCGTRSPRVDEPRRRPAPPLRAGPCSAWRGLGGARRRRGDRQVRPRRPGHQRDASTRPGRPSRRVRVRARRRRRRRGRRLGDRLRARRHDRAHRPS